MTCISCKWIINFPSSEFNNCAFVSRFNTEKAIVIGTLTFGLLLIGLSFVKSKPDKSND